VREDVHDSLLGGDLDRPLDLEMMLVDVWQSQGVNYVRHLG
jgi:hypothetical protein